MNQDEIDDQTIKSSEIKDSLLHDVVEEASTEEL